MRDANYKVTNHVCFFNFKTFLFHAKYPEIFKHFPSNLIKQKKASRKIVRRTSPILDGSPRHHRLDVVIAWCGTQNLNSYHERIGTGKMIFEAMAPKIASKNYF